MRRKIYGIIFFAIALCFSHRAISGPYNDGFIFLADTVGHKQYQVCGYVGGNIGCLTNHASGVTNLWRLQSPYVAYQLLEEGKTRIFFLNLRTGVAARKASISIYGQNSFDSWVSPGGDRITSIESAPFGKLLVSQGIFLDSSHQTIKKLDAEMAVIGWSYPSDTLYLLDKGHNSLVTISANGGHQKQIVKPLADGIEISEASISSDGSVYAISWKKDPGYYLETISNGKRTLIVESASLHSPYITGDAEHVGYIEKKNDKYNVVNVYELASKQNTKSFSVDFDIKNLMLLPEHIFHFSYTLRPSAGSPP